MAPSDEVSATLASWPCVAADLQRHEYLKRWQRASKSAHITPSKAAVTEG